MVGDRVVAVAIIALGHILGLEVIVGGVEAGWQFDYFSKHGCDWFQGDLFSPPISASEISKLQF